jgi:two-component system, NarL family, response regulator
MTPSLIGAPGAAENSSRSPDCELAEPIDQEVILGRFDPIVAHGLAAVLRGDPSLRVVATGIDDQGLEQAVSASAPRIVVILVDEAVGSQAIECLRAAWPTVCIVVFAKHPSLHYGRLLLAFGVSCVTYSVLPVDLLAAVRRTGLGDRVFIPSDGDSIEWRGNDPQMLSRREQQVLRHLIQDMSHAMIAEELGIALRTVGTHITRIYQKLGVGSRREAVVLFSPGWFGAPVRQSGRA